MRSYSMIYMREIVENLYNDIESKDRGISFVKHYNSLNVKKEDIKELLPDGKNITMLYYEYKSSDMPDAYAPWLEWLKEIYEKKYSIFMSVEDFVENCRVYELQKSMFISYIKTGKIDRYEPLVIVEVDFEREMFIKSLIKSYEYILSKYKFYFVVNKIHLASDVTFEFIKEFLCNENFTNCAMLFTYNEVYTKRNEDNNSWNELQQVIESMRLLTDWLIRSEEVIESNKAFAPVEDDIEKYFLKILNMIYTFSLTEATYYLDILYNLAFRNKMNLSKNDVYRLYAIYCYCCICKGEHNMAFHLCERIQDFNDTDEKLLWIYYLESMAYEKIGHVILAKEIAQKCYEVASRMNDKDKLFYAKLRYNVSMFSGWNSFVHIFNEADIDDDFLEELEERKFYNYAGYFYAYLYKNITKVIIDGEPVNEPEYLKKAIGFAESNKNYNQLITIYIRCIALATEKSYHDIIDYYYKKSFEVLEARGDILEVANANVGQGYAKILYEKHDLANSYFNKAIKIFYEQNMPENIAEIFYNMSLNAFMAEDYRMASYYMNAVLRMLELLKIFRLRVCNITKIYGIIAYSNYAMGMEYNAYIYINLIEKMISHLFDVKDEKDYDFWDDDLLLYYLVCAAIKLNEGDLKTSKEYFDRVEFHMFRTEAFMQFTYYIYTVELVKYYRYINDEEEAEKAIDRCMEYCNEKKFFVKEMKLSKLKKRMNSSHMIENLALEEIKMSDILKEAENKGVLKDLRKKDKDIEYFIFWQELLNNEKYDTEEELLNVAINSLKSYYAIEKIIYIEIIDGKSIVKYTDREIDRDFVDKIIRIENSIGKDFVANRSARTFDEYEEIISLFDISQIVSMSNIISTKNNTISNIFISYNTINVSFSNQMMSMNTETFRIYKLLFIHLTETLNRRRAIKQVENNNRQLNFVNKQLYDLNEQLSKIAVTDQLTGLLNRQGLDRRIRECEYNQFEDFNMQERIISVMYIDLDNFKYYNDRFNHDMGDTILKHFADILNRICNNIGYVVRYGGDEFIMIFPGKSVVEIVEYAKNILFQFSSNVMYLNMGISQDEINIAMQNNKKLSASIGIATTTECNKNGIDDALKKADAALYYTKKNKKSGYMVWNEEIGVEY